MVTRRAAALALILGFVARSSVRAADQRDAASPTPRIGVIHPYAATEAAYAAFREGLVQLGYDDGQTISIEPRFAEGRQDLLRAFAAELVALRVDLIVAFGAGAVRAARWATNALPVVFVVGQDPFADGLVTDAGRGNVAGITNADPAQPRAQMRLLKQVLPGLARVAILGDAGVNDAMDRASIAAAEAEGLRPLAARLRGADENIDSLIEAAREDGAGAVLCLAAPVTALHSTRIAVKAIDMRLATMFPGSWLPYGSLLAFGSSLVEAARQLARMTDRVLKGRAPATLRIEVNTRHDLGINLRVAREIGVTIPPNVLALATHVIE